MFRIREFSRLARVSMPALRHYDRVGLLIPARVDPDTAYRYYTADQLPRLHRILAFKDLGFSLTQIADMLDADLPAAELRGMLKLKRSEMERLIEREQDRLARIEARLRAIEQDGAAPWVAPFTGNGEVAVRVLPDVETMACVVHRGDYRGIARAYAALYTWVEANGYVPSGPERQVHLRYGGDSAMYITELHLPIHKRRRGAVPVHQE